MIKPSKLRIRKITEIDVYDHPLHSIGVEDDESFISDGGIHSHNCMNNCYCKLVYVNTTPEKAQEVMRKLGGARAILTRLKKEGAIS